MNTEIKHQLHAATFDQMLEDSIGQDQVASLLAGDALLLTVSDALAIDWKRRLVANSGKESSVAATPNVTSWRAWVSGMAFAQTDIPVAFNRLQENCLWEQVITEDMARSPLMQTLPSQASASIRGLAAHARSAYALMQEYGIGIDELGGGGDEPEALRRWIKAIRNHMQEKEFSGRALSADIPALLHTSINKQTSLPQTVLLDGFDKPSPMQLAIVSQVQASGCRVLSVSSQNKRYTPKAFGCSDARAESLHVASRIKSILMQYPDANIAILTSSSVTDTGLLRRALNEILPDPDNGLAAPMQAVVMQGDSLARSPLVRQVLHLLALAGEYTIAAADFSRLLFIPWLKGYDSERLQRAELDALFREQNRHRMPVQSLIHSPDVQALPALLGTIKALSTWSRTKRSAGDWVSAVRDLLRVTGFVAADGRDAGRVDHEIRQMNAFREALLSLVAVDAVGGKLSWSGFLGLLQAACSEAQLSMPARYANVAVMPLEQAAGLRFDHVLVMGLDEDALPLPARPQTLLPAAIQKKYAIPMSSAKLAYEASLRLWQQLLESSAAIEVSYARLRDERELQPSSFLADMEVLDAPPVGGEVSQALGQASYEDAPFVPMQTGEIIRGGTDIVRNQSACPFRAFATHRLQVSTLDETEPGIEASRKGSLIHLALEYIWKHLQRRASLQAMTEEQTGALVDSAIEHAWREKPAPVDALSREFEKKRMRHVLVEWLAVELERPDFRVLEIEKKYELSLPENGHPSFDVHIKADRMDEDTQGHRILIDYKTGRGQSASHWLASEENERIAEPQLPQYALAAGLGVDDAVSFARVRSGDMAFEGMAGEDTGIKGIKACDDWQQVLDDWKSGINMLATEFVSGRSEVSPRDAGVCKYCGLEAVCRVEETDFDIADDSIDDESAP